MPGRRYLEEDDDDPMLSMVNIIDVFLVIIVILFILIMKNPFSSLIAADNFTIVHEKGGEDIEMIIKQGNELVRYQTSGSIGTGEGVKAGVTYRLPDGTLVYVPEGNP
ncbi:MAG: DUF2149 domain-containing protein [Verrucomicrobia bacterium]|nr:DUF2149 domain-containing protein [Verrucomicrobiota bacterium]